MRLRQPRLGETRQHGCATHCPLTLEKDISFCWVPTFSIFLLPQYGLVLRALGGTLFLWLVLDETAWSRCDFLSDTSMLGRWTFSDRSRSGADLSGTASRQNTENMEKQFASDHSIGWLAPSVKRLYFVWTLLPSGNKQSELASNPNSTWQERVESSWLCHLLPVGCHPIPWLLGRRCRLQGCGHQACRVPIRSRCVLVMFLCKLQLWDPRSWLCGRGCRLQGCGHQACRVHIQCLCVLVVFSARSERPGQGRKGGAGGRGLGFPSGWKVAPRRFDRFSDKKDPYRYS